MDLQIIAVPYDSGRRGWRMGAGPEHLLHSGLTEALEEDGHVVNVIMLESNEDDDVLSSFDLARQISLQVTEARRQDAFPIILAGNCIASVGAFGGIKSSSAMLWADAHADFNTPDTSESGFLDGMTLAIMTGRCWTDQTDRILGFKSLPPSELVLLGVRSIDKGEKPAMKNVWLAQNEKQLATALTRLRRDELYLHIDLDALDPSTLTANSFATAGGLSVETLRACIRVAHAKRFSAVAVTAYDPSADTANAAPAIVVELIRTVIAPGN